MTKHELVEALLKLPEKYKVPEYLCSCRLNRGKYDSANCDEYDREDAHVEADKLLLEYIKDPQIKRAYDKLYKWYS